MLCSGVSKMNQKHVAAISAAAALALLASTAHAVTTIPLGTVSTPTTITGSGTYTAGETLDFTFTIVAPLNYLFTDTITVLIGESEIPFTSSSTGEAGVYSETSGPIPFSGTYTYSLTTTDVPEPAAWALMLVGFGGLGAALRTRRRAIAAV
jgi:hypothetical protein